jgi:hypothetical protein
MANCIVRHRIQAGVGPRGQISSVPDAAWISKAMKKQFQD